MTPNQNRQPQTTSQQILNHARVLAQKGHLREAKAVLEAIPGHPVAQKWLIQINGSLLDEELAFEFPDSAPLANQTPIAPQFEYNFWSTGRKIYADLTQTTLAILMFSGVLIVLAMLMVINFIALSWIDSRDAVLWTPDFEGVSRTALQIWYGADQGPFSTLDLERDARGESGFRSVRMVDRLLIVIPFGAIYVILLSLRFVIFPKRSDRSIFVLTGIALVLFLMPYVWETMSTRQWQGYLDSVPPERLFGPYGEGLRVTFGDQALSELAGEFLAILLYDTFEQKVLGAAALLVCLVMFGGTLARRRHQTNLQPMADEPLHQ